MQNKREFSFHLIHQKISLFFLIILISFFSSLISSGFSFDSNDKIVAAAFFYWYDNETGSHLWSGAEKKDYKITFLPKMIDREGAFPGFSYKDKEWFRNEVEDMIAAGLNVIAPIIWPSPDPTNWTRIGLTNLLDTMLEMQKEGYKVPKIAIYFDTSTIQFEEFDRIRKETGKPVDFSDPKRPWVVNLTEQKNIQRFYNCVKNCFIYITGESPENFNPLSFVPEKSKYYDLWAMSEGFPMVFIWEAGRGFFFDDWDERLFDYIVKQFEKDFHLKPRLYPDYEWSLKSDKDNITQFNLNGGGYIRWRASVFEPYAMDEPVMMPLKGPDGIEFGPGYDDRVLADRLINGTPIRSRDNGYFHCYGWQYAFRTNKNLVMLESWNELHEGTQLCDTYELSRKYIHLNQNYVENFSVDYSKMQTVRCELKPFNYEQLNIINNEFGLYQVDGGVLRSTEQPFNQKETDYVFDQLPATKGKTKPFSVKGVMGRRTDYPAYPFMYFDIDEDFAKTIIPNSDLFVTVKYFDKDKDFFRIGYNSSPHKFSEKVQKNDTKEFKYYTFKLDNPDLNNPLAGSINHYSFIKKGCDFFIDSMGDGDEYICEAVVSKTPDIIVVEYPETCYPNDEVKIKIRVLNNGKTNENYEGKIQIACSDNSALKPIEYKFKRSDKGEKVFPIKLLKAGEFFFSVKDLDNPAICINNLKIIVQKFKIELTESVKKGKFIKMNISCLKDDGGVDSEALNKIKFSKPNMNDIIPLKYEFDKADLGKAELECQINNYGDSVITVEDTKNLTYKGFLKIKIPIPTCTIYLEDEPISSGIEYLEISDGGYELDYVGKRQCWKISFNSPTTNKIYFDVDDGLYKNLPKYNNIYILVKYYDARDGEFIIDYDSNDIYCYPTGFKPTITQAVKLSNSNRWKTAIIYLEDAYFGNRCHSGDFRIRATKGEVLISQVTVLPQFGNHPDKKNIQQDSKFFFTKNTLIFIFIILALIILILAMIVILQLYKDKLSIFSEYLQNIDIKYFLIVISIILFLSMLFIKPRLSGDGVEYFLMVESLENHFSPDLRENDKIDTIQIFEKNGTNYPLPNLGFFEGLSGKQYCWHFWLYSLSNIPVKLVLKLLNANELKCFQITNVIFFLLSLWIVYFALKRDILKRNLLIILFLFNPAIWYIIWSHPEIFCYSLVIISLTMMMINNMKTAILLSSIASTQNPPLIIVSLIIFLYFLIEQYNQFKIKKTVGYLNIILAFLCIFPAFVPSIFYKIVLGYSNPLIKTGIAGFKYVSLERVHSLFFDLNMGMIIYIPIIILLFFIAIFKALLKKDLKNLIIPIGIFFMAFLSTMTANWNCGCSGIVRYAIWIIPVIIYFIILNTNFKSKLYQYVLLAGIIFQILMLIFNGGLICNIKYLKLNNFSKFVMKYAPFLYNPEESIFTERIVGTEFYHGGLHIKIFLPIFFDKDDYITKVYGSANHISDLKQYCNIKSIRYYKKLLKKIADEKDKDKLKYFNFPIGFATYKGNIIESIPNGEYKYKIDIIKKVEVVKKNELFHFLVKLTNTSNLNWSDRFLEDGKYRIALSYHWLNKDGVVEILDGVRTPLPKMVNSGKSIEILMNIIAPDKTGDYILELDMIHEQCAWFGSMGATTVKVPIKVVD